MRSAEASIRSRTSSMREMSSWMSPRSMGVMKVWCSRSITVWVISSPWCSTALTRAACSSGSTPSCSTLPRSVAAARSREAATLLGKVLHDGVDPEEQAARVKAVEHQGDEITHTVIERLHQTFITPIDRGDIHELISRMDDVLDLIEASAERIALYDIRTMEPEARELGDVLEKSVEEMEAAGRTLHRDQPPGERGRPAPAARGGPPLPREPRSHPRHQVEGDLRLPGERHRSLRGRRQRDRRRRARVHLIRGPALAHPHDRPLDPRRSVRAAAAGPS